MRGGGGQRPGAGGERAETMSRFLIACGGTGGHLSPGIALAEGLNARGHETTLLISRKKVDARLIAKYPQLHFERIPGAPFSLRPVGLARCLWQQAAAFWFSARIIRRWRPDLIVGFRRLHHGGHHRGGGVVPPAGGAARGEPGAGPGHPVARRAGAAPVPAPGRAPCGACGGPACATSGCPSAARSSACRARPRRSGSVSIPRKRCSSSSAAARAPRPLNHWVRGRLERLAAEGIQVCCVTGLDKGGDEVARTAGRRPAGRSGRSSCRSATTWPRCSRRPISSCRAPARARSPSSSAARRRPSSCRFPQAADNHQWANARFFERQGGRHRHRPAVPRRPRARGARRDLQRLAAPQVPRQPAADGPGQLAGPDARRPGEPGRAPRGRQARPGGPVRRRRRPRGSEAA